MYVAVCFLHGPGSIPAVWQSISRDFSLSDHTLPTRPENGSISPQPVDIEERGRSSTMDRE